ncbi:unnamed protein product [Lactuca saligna]|uniref:F-box domain-containing protein n=1 Tax=Lactuca saligna TaxID=75948 RepID=A0AA35YJD9_LACSI|nr:unnamed protein product [Lactuca saligna]
MEFSGEKEMSKKGVVVSIDEKPSEWRTWEGLHPDILASIFLRLTVEEISRCVPLVCKPWMEVASGPYCWIDIDIQAWCRSRDRSLRAVNRAVNKLIRRSNFTVERLFVYRMGSSGFLSVVNCPYLKVLEIPLSRFTDTLVLNHLKPLPNLRVLNINYCSKISAKGLAAFGNQCKSLLHLKRNLPPQRYWPVDNSEAKTIADTMPNLQRIELCFGSFGDWGLSEILTKCKSLTHLDIRGCWNVKLNGDLKKMCGKLECFQIHPSDFSEQDQLRLFYRYWKVNENETDLFVELQTYWNDIIIR